MYFTNIVPLMHILSSGGPNIRDVPKMRVRIMLEASVGQAYEVLSLLANRIERWLPGLDKDRLQEEVIKDPERMAKSFGEFLRNGARAVIIVVASFVLKLVSCFSPSDFIGEDWTVWKGPANGNGFVGDEDRDVREDNFSEIDWSKAEFTTCLEDGEPRITGEEKLCRLKKSGEIRYGGRAFLSLLKDYQENGESSVLENLYRTKGIKYVDFFGLIIRAPNGSRNVLYLYRFGGGMWGWSYFWLVFKWGDKGFSAVSQVSSN